MPVVDTQPRPSRSNSVSTTTESSLPSPPNSSADLPSPPARLPTDSPPPPSAMSASLGRLDGAAMARAGLSADADFASQAVRAKKGQKRHSISGGSAFAFPHLAPHPSHIVLKAPAGKKKARLDQQQQLQAVRPAGHHSFSLSDLPRPLTMLSASVPVSSPISIPANGIGGGAGGAAAAVGGGADGEGANNGLPCSKCAALLPLRSSSSVPLSEDPICERCSESAHPHLHSHHNGGHRLHVHPHHHHHHQRAFSSSSVPVRSTMAQFALPAGTALEAWDSGDEDYEIVTRPSSPVTGPAPRKAHHHHHQAGAGWSLEEEFSFLDTVDSDEEAAPAQPTLAGWGGPFFRNMPMPPPKMPHSAMVAQQQQQQQQHQQQQQQAAQAAAAAYPSPVSSFLGYGGGQHHRSSTAASSPSSASSQSPFPSNLPTPGEAHGGGLHGGGGGGPTAGIHLGGDYPPASPVTDSAAAFSLSQRRGLGSAKLNLTNGTGGLLQQQQQAFGLLNAPSTGGGGNGGGRQAKPPAPITTLFHHANDLEFLVRGGPPSPIVFGSHAMRRGMSNGGGGGSNAGSVLGLGGTHHGRDLAGAGGMDDHHMGGAGADMLMTEEVEMEDLQ